MKTSKLWSILLLVVLLSGGILWGTIPVSASEPGDNDQESVGIRDPYPMVPDPFPLDNTLNPLSPNYSPEYRYGPEGTRFGPPGKREGDAGVDWLTHHYFGTKLKQDNRIDGAQAIHYVSTTLTLKDSSGYLYAPTLMAPNNCALESVTYYHRTILGITNRRWQVYDHVSRDFVYDTPINDSFLDKYVRLGGYKTKVIKSDSTWKAYLFNYNTSQWEEKWTKTGSSGWTFGWDYWEEYDLDNDWPTLPKIEASYILVRRGDLGDYWYYATSTYAEQFTSPNFPPGGFPYPYGWTSQYYHWYVGPN